MGNVSLDVCSNPMCGDPKEDYELYVDPMITPREGENQSNMQMEIMRRQREAVL